MASKTTCEIQRAASEPVPVACPAFPHVRLAGVGVHQQAENMLDTARARRVVIDLVRVISGKAPLAKAHGENLPVALRIDDENPPFM